MKKMTSCLNIDQKHSRKLLSNEVKCCKELRSLFIGGPGGQVTIFKKEH